MTRAPVLMQDRVVPMRARNTVRAWTSMKALPAAGLPNSHVPAMIIMSPTGAAEPVTLLIWYPLCKKKFAAKYSMR